MSPTIARCPLARELDSSPLRASIKDRLLHAAIPLARAYVRYTPFDRSRDRLWTNWIEPYLAYHRHPFEAPTQFGPRIGGDTFEVLQQHVYYFGVWEPVLTRWLEARLSPGDTFIDVGANIGYFSMLASRMVGPTGSVVAIEASPTIFGQLERGLRSNRLENVRAVHAVVASEESTQMVYLGPPWHIGLAATHPGPELTPESEVRAAALPALLTPAELGRARFMKIDVEGAESDVIAGLAPKLAVTNPDLEIVIELHAGDRTAMFEALEAAGFHPYRLDIYSSPLRYWQLTEPPRPHRLREAVEGEFDVIFSRVDAELL